MSWSISKSGTKAEVVDAINVEHSRPYGNMPGLAHTYLVALVDQFDADRVALTASGHTDSSQSGMSANISKAR